MATPKSIEWQSLEHQHKIRSSDWFWIVGVVSIAGAILAVYFGNIIMAILIIIAGFTSILHGHTEPRILTFKINRRGVQAGSTLYSYSTLESFWVEDEHIHDKIIIKSQKFLMPYIILPYDSTKIDPDDIRNYLLEYMDEEEMEEPVLQQVMENLGF